MPREDGLGWISPNVADLQRPLKGKLANMDPLELTPPYRVQRADRAETDIDFYPAGVLVVYFRMAQHEPALDTVVKSDYMRWAIVESLAEVMERVGGVRCKGSDICFCMNQIEVLDTQVCELPSTAWQFCHARFDYKLRVPRREDDSRVARAVFTRMATFEEQFCKALEFKFREIYLLTVLGLTNKRYILMQGQRIANERRLYEAAQAGDRDGVLSLLGSRVDVDAHQDAKRYPTCLIEDEDFCHAFVVLGRTPLLAAAEAAQPEVLRMLLDRRADANFQDTGGFHALLLAAGASSLSSVELLLSRRADIHLGNKDGYTALHNASGSGASKDVVVALLAAHADLGSRTKLGAAPAHVAVYCGQTSSLEILKELGANMDAPAFGGNTPLHESVMKDSPELIKRLFDLAADINVESGPEHNFATPLAMAIGRNKEKAAAQLRELGAVEQLPHEAHLGPAAFEDFQRHRELQRAAVAKAKTGSPSKDRRSVDT